MDKKNIMIIFGGPSGEHEVSLNSAKAVIENLNKEKYNLIPVAIDRQGNWLLGKKGNEYLISNTQKKDIKEQIAKEESQALIEAEQKDIANFQQGELGVDKIDLVLPIIHGPYGEDGKLQGMLEMLGLPYAFSDVLASSLAMNKPKTKIIAQNAGLKVSPGLVLSKNNNYNLDEIINQLDLPIVVKPSELGSSVGVFISKTKEDLEGDIKESLKHCDKVLLEKFVKGRELQCAVVGNNPPKALPVIEIIPKVSEFFDYKAKYEVGGSEEICPAQITDQLRDQIQFESVKIFKEIGCSDLARVDFIWDEANNQIYFLEINTIPGMTATSLVPQEAKADKMEFFELLDLLIDEALKRYEK